MTADSAEDGPDQQVPDMNREMPEVCVLIVPAVESLWSWWFRKSLTSPADLAVGDISIRPLPAYHHW